MNVNQKFNDEAIDAHNKLRALHGCLPLKLDRDLASSSQKYAEVLAKRNCLEHSKDNNYGENLAYRSGNGASDFNGTEASIMWYSEIKDYDYCTPNTSKCGHFSQVVWKSTSLAGFGKSVTADGTSVFVVGRYNPPGNFMGQWVENVPRTLDGKSTIPTAEELATPKKTEKNPQIISQENKFSQIDPTLKEYCAKMIQSQNDVRKKFGVRLLRESKELNDMAQQMAGKIKGDHKYVPRNVQYNGQNVGQIIFHSRVKNHNPENIVKSWCKERRNYKKEYDVSSLHSATHFTQLIWNGSSELGVGAVLSRSLRASIVVCLYSPAGNVPEGYADNITPFWNKN